MAKCLGLMHFTSEVVAVDIDCWQRTVAEQLVGLLASVGACNESVLPLVEANKKLFTGLLIPTKSAEANPVLVLLSTADTEPHARASICLSGRADFNLVIPLSLVAGRRAMFRSRQQPHVH